MDGDNYLHDVGEHPATQSGTGTGCGLVFDMYFHFAPTSFVEIKGSVALQGSRCFCGITEATVLP